MDELDSQTSARLKRTPAPKRDGCTCPRHGAKRTRQFRREAYSTLPCYCGDPPSGRCTCSDPAWGDSLVSTYVGQLYARSPREFDDETNRRMFSVGQMLHCVVRAAANQTPPDVPGDCTLRDYEHKVFQSRWTKPFNLAVQDWQVAYFFQGRIRYAQMDFLKKHVQDVKGAKKLKESLKDAPEASQSEKSPVHPMAQEGGLLRVILGMPEAEWHYSFQAIHALLLLGLVESITEAANLLSASGDCKKQSESFRSDWNRGRDYLIEHSEEVSREVALHELASVRITAHRDGVQSIVALLITDENDQAAFLELLAQQRTLQKEQLLSEPKVEEDEE